MTWQACTSPPVEAKYIIEYRDANGKRHRKSGCTDKAMTQRLAKDIENRKAPAQEGLIDPAAERFADSGRKPIVQHLDDFTASMEARARDDKHIKTTRTYIERIVAKPAPGMYPIFHQQPLPWPSGRSGKSLNCPPAPSTPMRPPSRDSSAGHGRMAGFEPMNSGTSAAAMNKPTAVTCAAP